MPVCISEGMFRAGDLNLKCEALQLHEIIKGSKCRLKSIEVPGLCLEHSNMKMQGNEEELAKVGGNPGTCGELKAK